MLLVALPREIQSQMISVRFGIGVPFHVRIMPFAKEPGCFVISRVDLLVDLGGILTAMVGQRGS